MYILLYHFNYRFDRTLGGHVMEMRMRDHLIKLFKVMHDMIHCHFQINQQNDVNAKKRQTTNLR